MLPGPAPPDTPEHYGLQLQDECWCIRYLFGLKWPHGFQCSVCGWSPRHQKPAKSITCSQCGSTSSISSGTLLHGTKKDLSFWLQVVWWVCSQSDPIRITQLQRQLGTRSYQTAWTWRRKLRLAMLMANRQKCSGTVEIDSAPAPLQAALGENHFLIAALEFNPRNQLSGRMQIRRYDYLAYETVIRFIKDSISPGSTVVAPDKEPFRCLPSYNYLYTIEPEKPVQESVQGLFSKLFLNGEGSFCPDTKAEHIDSFLSDFSFRQNCGLLSDKRSVFELLLGSLLHHGPTPNRLLVSPPKSCRGAI